MTLEEAIKHCEEKANENNAKAKKIAREKKPFLEYASCKQCAEEHEQLAEWLKELKTLRERRPHGKWTDESQESLKCSACGMRVYKPFIGGFPTERTKHYWPNYCAFCGADMRKGDDL